ncbi:hypothetical protein C8R44DRAFT_941631 [Mycena epipterygia]|nr:hypothetical protein C8R44DRAFT_941631 [Mycena epipterygia]
MMCSAVGYDAKENARKRSFPSRRDSTRTTYSRIAPRESRVVSQLHREPAPRPRSDSATRSIAVLTSGFPASKRRRKSLGAASIIRAVPPRRYRTEKSPDVESYIRGRRLASAFANPTYIPQATHAICGRAARWNVAAASGNRSAWWVVGTELAVRRGGGCGGERSAGWTRIQAGGAGERNGVGGVMARAAVREWAPRLAISPEMARGCERGWADGPDLRGRKRPRRKLKEKTYGARNAKT